jgi:hypothetical protein
MQEKQRPGVLRMGGAMGGARRLGKMKMERQANRQNLSIRITESVILGELQGRDTVTTPREGTENTEFSSRRTHDLGHLHIWPLECDSRYELVIQPNYSNGDEDIKCGNKKASHSSNC